MSVHLSHRRFRRAGLSCAVAGAMLGTTTAALAQTTDTADTTEQAAPSVERIAVTGSRLKRIAVEGASPIITISAADIAATGYTTVSDVLRNSNLNSFGSWGGGANNSWGSQSTVALKGSSVNHTLTLLNGRRMAKSPVLDGGASNLNTIPAAAIERIEILSDGASAIYGTDAIAGVINIILRDDFQGVEVQVKGERPEAEGGDSEFYSFTGGLSGEMGNMVFSWEHYEYDPIMQKDRDFLKAHVVEGDGTHIQDWVGLSTSGRTLMKNASTWDWLNPIVNANGSCDMYNLGNSTEFYGELQDYDYPSDRLCAYDYTLEAAWGSKIRRDSMLMNYTYDINSDVTLTARGYWSNQEALDVSAPTPATIWFDKDLPSYETAEGWILREVEAGDGLRYRFNTLGNRIAEHNDNNLDLLIALEGSTDRFSWDVSANYNRYNYFVWGRNYLLSSALTDAVGDVNADTGQFEGWDPRDPHAVVPDAIVTNADKRAEAVYAELSGGVQFDLFELPGGAVSAYVGASLRNEQYRSSIDSQSEAGNVIGGNGGSGGAGERDVSAVYFESVLPLFDSVELNIAGRYDDYSDFGGTFNPQVSLRYKPMESLLLRASYGTGFRAPTLSDLYQSRVEGFEREVNYRLCHQDNAAQNPGLGVPELVEMTLSNCQVSGSEFSHISGGNPDIQPEESTTYNVGAVYQINDDWSVSLDAWQLELDDEIDELGDDAIIRMDYLNSLGLIEPVSSLFPGVGVSFNDGNRFVQLVNVTGNFGSSERSGVEFSLNGRMQTEWGDFSIKLNWSHFNKYTYTFVNSQGEFEVAQDQIGYIGYPEDRISSTLDYTLGDHRISLYSNYTSSQDRSGNNVLDDYISHNLTYRYAASWDADIALSVLNLTDKQPPLESNTNAPNTQLYNYTGRNLVLSYKQRF
ncbi:TonB-dependent receptor [Aestuariibacter halophilus]|uniref:TonB-dependent receptor n=1 Tax=Fluctibacter halophilus TaxID=226011 RepID=A0ABS8G358_9ALTE|nr:TonB-dependent receptor [Aestuariibacter halophilus]MCC2615005.1 TonB-dependent receptor [Aestuariibacter halophilus]